MDLKQEIRAFIVTGCIVAIVCAIPLGFFIGIGGALVSCVAGIVATCIAGVIRNRIAQNAKQSLEAHTQIQGVLDSSQLGKEEGEPTTQEVLPFARRGKLVAAAISLAFCLISAGIVGAATHGVGINFYLGGTPQATNKNASSANASSASSSSKRTIEDSQGSGQDTNSSASTVETWYPPEEEVPQSTGTEQQQQQQQQGTKPSSSSSNPAPSPSPSSSSQSGEGQGSGNAPSSSTPSSEQQSTPQAPANSGTIDNASQNAKEQ